MTRPTPEVAEAGIRDGIAGVHRWRRGAGLVAALALAFVSVAAIGARDVQRGVRVLGALDPLVAGISRSGGALTALALQQQTALGVVVCVVACGIALLGTIIGRRRGAPLLLLAAAVGLVVWGQIALLADRAVVGTYLYGAGFVCAIGLGVWCPITRLAGFPPLPLPGDPPAVPRRSWPGWELVLVFGLSVLALLSRVYALPELPHAFNGEMTISMLASHSLDGLRQYLPWGLLGNSTGLAHLLPQMASFRLFGTSVYTVRLAAVFYGVAAVPLCYWLARRMAGTVPAVVATLLFIAAPEQLFWSRSEDTHFAPVAVAALVTAHLGLWLTERVSVGALLAAALWMPLTRLFYVPAMLLVAYPLALYAHAVVVVRGTWRRVWYAIPLLAGGLILWLFTLTFANAAVNNWQWRFVNPTGWYAAGAWTQEGQLDGQLQGHGIAALLQLHARSAAANGVRVAAALAFRTSFSSFYVRADTSPHPTLINVGLLIMVVLGLGYLLGQVYERRAFALLIWVALGLLPALLSNDPADRRMAVVFPALYVIAGVFVAATVRMVRLGAGVMLARVTSAALAIAILGVAWSSLASHFRLPIGPLPVEAQFRFTQPLFQQSDVILHNLDWSMALLMVFGNLDAFVARQPCYHQVAPAEWLKAAVQLPCEFKDPVYRLTLPAARVVALRDAAPRRQRISFLLGNQPAMRQQLELLRALYPQARTSELRGPDEAVQLVALTIDFADAQALHTPVMMLGPGQPATAELGSRVLAGVKLAPSPEPVAAGLAVEGGLLIERTGWYRFALAPPCAPASLTVDAQPAAELRPLLAGVHAFELTVPDSAACALPLQLVLQAHAQPQPVAIEAAAIVSPAVVAAARAPALGTYEGYGAARRVAEPAGRIVDFGIDALGTVFVLTQAADGYRVHRYSAAGSAVESWQPQGVQGHSISAIAVAPDGRVLLRSDHSVWTFEPDGRPLSVWDNPPLGTADIALLDDGRSLSRLPDINTMAIVGGDGRLQAQWDAFAGAPGRFRFPVSVSRNQPGDVLIIENDGEALLFHNPPEHFEPQFVRRFPIAFSSLPVQPHGVAFAGEHILVPDPETKTTLVYHLDGQRLMAARPERDLDSREFGNVVRYQATESLLYVLDEARRLWVLSLNGEW